MNALLINRNNFHIQASKFAAKVNEELIEDNHRLSAALEKFAKLFADVSSINTDSLNELAEDLREAGRADLADSVAGWLQ